MSNVFETKIVKGIIYKLMNGVPHCVDAPAITYPAMVNDGGSVHREEHCHWYINGKLHNELGPTCVYSSTGTRNYFLDGVKYSEQEWKKEVARRRNAGENKQ